MMSWNVIGELIEHLAFDRGGSGRNEATLQATQVYTNPHLRCRADSRYFGAEQGTASRQSTARPEGLSRWLRCRTASDPPRPSASLRSPCSRPRCSRCSSSRNRRSRATTWTPSTTCASRLAAAERPSRSSRRSTAKPTSPSPSSRSRPSPRRWAPFGTPTCSSTTSPSCPRAPRTSRSDSRSPTSSRGARPSEAATSSGCGSGSPQLDLARRRVRLTRALYGFKKNADIIAPLGWLAEDVLKERFDAFYGYLPAALDESAIERAARDANRGQAPALRDRDVQVMHRPQALRRAPGRGHLVPGRAGRDARPRRVPRRDRADDRERGPRRAGISPEGSRASRPLRPSAPSSSRGSSHSSTSTPPSRPRPSMRSRVAARAPSSRTARRA